MGLSALVVWNSTEEMSKTNVETSKQKDLSRKFGFGKCWKPISVCQPDLPKEAHKSSHAGQGWEARGASGEAGGLSGKGCRVAKAETATANSPTWTLAPRPVEEVPNVVVERGEEEGLWHRSSVGSVCFSRHHQWARGPSVPGRFAKSQTSSPRKSHFCPDRPVGVFRGESEEAARTHDALCRVGGWASACDTTEGCCRAASASRRRRRDCHIESQGRIRGGSEGRSFARETSKSSRQDVAAIPGQDFSTNAHDTHSSRIVFLDGMVPPGIAGGVRVGEASHPGPSEIARLCRLLTTSLQSVPTRWEARGSQDRGQTSRKQFVGMFRAWPHEICQYATLVLRRTDHTSNARVVQLQARSTGSAHTQSLRQRKSLAFREDVQQTCVDFAGCCYPSTHSHRRRTHVTKDCDGCSR